jgi:hypothetical protein
MKPEFIRLNKALIAYNKMQGDAKDEEWVLENEGSSIYLKSGRPIIDVENYALNDVIASYILAVQPQAIFALLSEKDSILERLKAAEVVVEKLNKLLDADILDYDKNTSNVDDALSIYNRLKGGTQSED